MQTYPGGIQSGMDYYMNDAGLLVCETTIDQTRFDVNGMPLATRIRKALQYADTHRRGGGDPQGRATTACTRTNGCSADMKTNEIAMFELGTHEDASCGAVSKNEWFGGTEGFYWGCNNTKDLDVRLETIADVRERPHRPRGCRPPTATRNG